MHSKRRIKRDKKNCVQPEAYGRTVKVRWGYLMLLGILFSLEVAAFSANAQELQPERMQAIKKALISLQPDTAMILMPSRYHLYTIRNNETCFICHAICIRNPVGLTRHH